MTTSEDRERTRHELHELARMAEPLCADSSGYVDLSAYSSTDPKWIDHALARSRGQEPQEVASPLVSPLAWRETMGPVAMSAALDGTASGARQRRATIAVGSIVVGGLALIAISLALRSPSRATAATPATRSVEPLSLTLAAPPTVPLALPPIAPFPTDVSAPATPVATASAASTGHRISALPAFASKRKAASAGLPPPSRPASRAKPSSSFTLPKPAGGGDALLGAIQQSIATPASKGSH